MRREIAHVKNEGSEKNWSQKITRDTGQCWEKKSVVFLKGVSKKQRRSLKGQASNLSEEARMALDGSLPISIDHRLAPNPHESKYGDGWEDKIKKSARMKKL
eukprot:7801828-Ditylum_brightwellii.AAC.1